MIMQNDKNDTKNRKGRRGRGGAQRFQREKPEFEEKLLDLARVTRVVAGGKRFRFRATVAIGDKKGQVGVGVAKGNDVQQAIQKAVYQAKKRMVKVPVVNGTIARDITVKYGAAVIFLKPAPEGRGINAGGAVRVVSELAGVSDIIGKSLSRTSNKLNTARATVKAFDELSKTTRGRQQAEKKEKETTTQEQTHAAS